MNLKDKNIIITGGSLGIGKETARFLTEKGANVLVTGRSEERLLKVKSYTGAKHVVAVVNGTAALHMSLLL